MIDRLSQFLTALRNDLPEEFLVSLRPYSMEDDEEITHFVRILMVPSEQLHPVAWRAWELALEVYGDEPTPFLMTTVSPETSMQYYARELQEARLQTLTAPAGALYSPSAVLPLSADYRLVYFTYESVSPLTWPVPKGASRWTDYVSTLFWASTDWTDLLVDINQARRNLEMDAHLASPALAVRPDDPSDSNYPLAA